MKSKEEREALMKEKNMAEEERINLAKELEHRKEVLEQERKQREALARKLKAMQEKLIVGGEKYSGVQTRGVASTGRGVGRKKTRGTETATRAGESAADGCGGALHERPRSGDQNKEAEKALGQTAISTTRNRFAKRIPARTGYVKHHSFDTDAQATCHRLVYPTRVGKDEASDVRGPRRMGHPAS
eukprot:05852_4